MIGAEHLSYALRILFHVQKTSVIHFPLERHTGMHWHSNVHKAIESSDLSKHLQSLTVLGAFWCLYEKMKRKKKYLCFVDLLGTLWLPKFALCLSTQSLVPAFNLKLKVMCMCSHSLPLASRAGKSSSEAFCKITASGYKEIVLICQNISAYIIAFFPPFWTCPNREHVPRSPLDFSFYRNKCQQGTICNSPWWQRRLLGIKVIFLHMD